MRIKVLQIGAENFGFGGRSVIAYNLTKFMSPDIQNDFLAYSDYLESNVTKDICKRGRIIRIKERRNSETVKLIKKEKYDIVHIHADHAYEAMKSIINARRGGVKKIVVHAHNTGAENIGLAKKVVIEICKVLMPYFIDRSFACTDEAAQYMFGKKFASKVTVIKDGIDVEKYQFNQDSRNKIRQELGISDEVVLGNVGRLSYQKNQEFLIDLFNEYKKKKRFSKLVIVGSGNKLNSLKRQVEKLNLTDDVFFLGNRSDVPAILSAMDIFVFPSRYEGFGMAALEAQASGLPTITSTEVPNKARVVKDLCAARNIMSSTADWLITIEQMLGNNRIEDSAKASGTIRFLGYDIRTSSKALELLYRKMINEAQD